MRSLTVSLIMLPVLAACNPSGETTQPAPSPMPQAAGAVERLKADLDGLLAADAVVEKVAGGFQFIEGPVWIGDADSGHLLFSDIPAAKAYRWHETEGTSVFLDAANGEGNTNGLALDPSGRLVLCEHSNRRITRLEPDGSRVVLAERYEGKRLNSPNDIVYHSNGSAFFTDPPYGLASPKARELDWQGVYRLDPDGSLHLLADGQSRPNGIGLSPDERTLYVANSDGNAAFWMAYPIADDLTLGEGRILLDLTGAEPGVPDGLAVDSLGNIWGSGPGGVVVISPEGDHLGTIRTPELPANAAFGNDGKTLYITARTGLYRIRTLATGLMP